MQFSQNNLLMTDHFFLRITQLKVRFLIWFFKLPSSPYLVSQVITATTLFLQFILYSSSFVGTLKNEIQEAALELCKLKFKRLSPDILKFRTKHEDNPFTLNCSEVPRSSLFVFHAASRGLGSNNSRNPSYQEKTTCSARIFRLSSVSYDYDQISPVLNWVMFLTCQCQCYIAISFIWIYVLNYSSNSFLSKTYKR